MLSPWFDHCYNRPHSNMELKSLSLFVFFFVMCTVSHLSNFYFLFEYKLLFSLRFFTHEIHNYFMSRDQTTTKYVAEIKIISVAIRTFLRQLFNPYLKLFYSKYILNIHVYIHYKPHQFEFPWHKFCCIFHAIYLLLKNICYNQRICSEDEWINVSCTVQAVNSNTYPPNNFNYNSQREEHTHTFPPNLNGVLFNALRTLLTGKYHE